MTNPATQPTANLNAPAMGGGMSAPPANWWEAAPLAQDVPQDAAQSAQAGNWWESFPLADDSPAPQLSQEDEANALLNRKYQGTFIGRNIANNGIFGDADFDAASLSDIERREMIGRDAAKASTLNGLTFGLSDEIAGFAAGIIPGGKTREEARDLSRDLKAYDRKHHPKAAIASEIGGGLMTGGAGLTRTAAAQTAKQTGFRGALASAGQGAKVGTVSGGAYGFGNAEGDIVDRLDETGKGAAYGAIGGAALNPLIKGMGAGLTSLASGKSASLAPAEKILLGEVMRANKLSRTDALKLIRDTDVSDPRLAFQKLGLEEMAQGVEAVGDSRVKTIFSRAVQKQQEGQQKRISAGVKRIIGADDFSSMSDDIATKLKTEGSQLYQDAFAQPFEPSRKIGQLMQRPSMKRATAIANRLAADSGMKPNGNDLQYFQLVKEALDDMASAAYKKGHNKQAGAIKDMQATLLAEMDAQVPIYAKARSTWAGQKANKAALEYGRNALKMRPEDIQRDIAGFSKSEKQHLLSGVLQGVDDRLKKAALSHDATARFKAESLRDAFRVILPERQADEVIELLNAESALTASGRRVRSATGSQTAPRQESAERVRGLTTSATRKTAARAADLAATPIESPKAYLKRLGALARKENPAVVEALAIRLAGTPDEVAQAFDGLSPQLQARTNALFGRMANGASFLHGQQTGRQASAQYR